MKNLKSARARIENGLQNKLGKIEKSGVAQTERAKKQAAIRLARIDEEQKRVDEKNEAKEKKRIIPIFFAADKNYLPYLSVSLLSLIENASKLFSYKIYILHTDIDENAQHPFKSFCDDNFSVEFVNVTESLETVKARLQLRDYYTGATYYRIFIADMFPEYDKALYLDSDTVVLGDISKLFGYSLNGCFVGAVTDKVVNGNAVFKRYSREVLGIEPQNYFNAGILLMNLKKFRTDGFYEKFCSLLSEYKFTVAQDQDYLNVICKNKVKYLPYCWNTMPVGGKSKIIPKLVHYNLTLKPWHYADIPYAEIFWRYALKSSYSDSIRQVFGKHGVKEQQKDDKTEANLVALAQSEIDRTDNFIKARRKASAEQNADIFDLFNDEIFVTEGSKSLG